MFWISHTVDGRIGSYWLVLMIWLTLAVPAHGADVYVSFDADGQAQFAEKPLDENYRLLFKDMAQVNVTTGPASRRAPPEVRRVLEQAAERHGLDYMLLHAVTEAESGFNVRAISPKGAIGLMQLMPDTARRYGVPGTDAADLRRNLHGIQVNVDAGSRYLKDLLRLFDGEVELALAAYNAGEGAVRRSGNRIPNYRETHDYVRKVMQTYRQLQANASSDAGQLLDAPLVSPPFWSLVESSGAQAPRGAGARVQVFRGDAAVEVQRFERGFTILAGP
ncbi:lytic transglycosylase domain-containing protein [Corticibacter populi]|uniref:Lytic transglycosylase domain-containing protein n=1 Tax=Corticibacter populi TaxID=1550736 RepID=A0A3M6QWE8_9BURK|nr:lytic transglycosylase domain-containing protein [Corticibacter populi]RMX06842.1 lytic transglycosylase domain-containing protein [Corticibacter populi]RZS31568.1 transglycosylase-like protein with SLT domain [Corticibacter populi]